MNRGYLQCDQDQSYIFYTSIIGTNHRIHEETVDLCRRKNDFICLICRQPSRLAEALQYHGLEMIAQGPKAHGFWNVSMTLTVDSENGENLSLNGPWYYRAASDVDASKDGQPWKYVFSSDELPTFCRLLLKLSKFRGLLLQKMILCIEINPAILNGQAKEIDSTPAGRSRTQKLLEPLRQLHSLGAAHVEGPVSSSYKRSMNASLCGDAPTAMDLIEISMQALVRGDKDFGKGQLLQANELYKSALNHVRCCCWRYDEDDMILDDGPFPGFEAYQVLSNLEVRLRARIASVYLKDGMVRMARIYTERAMDPRRPYDGRGNKEYTLDIEPWEGVVYAEVLHVAAHIRYIQGNAWEAMGHLDDAREYVPLNEEQQSTYEAWQARANVLDERRKKKQRAREMQQEKHMKKTEGIETPARNSLVYMKRS